MKANIKKALTGIVLLAMLLTAILPYTAIAVEGTTNSASLTDNGNVTGENLLANAATGDKIDAKYFAFKVEGQDSYKPGEDFTGITSGTIADAEGLPAIDGYTFQYAYVGTEDKKVIDLVVYSDSVYYRLDGGYVAAMKLGENDKITLKYTKNFDQFDVTYEGAGLGTLTGSDKAPEVEGKDFTAFYTQPATVEKVEFKVTRTVDSVTTELIYGTDYTVNKETDSNRHDIVIYNSAINGALTITAIETAKSQYTLTLTGSNSVYKTDTSNWNKLFQDWENQPQTEKLDCIEGTFYLHGYYKYNRNVAKALNKISIRIGSTDYLLNLPEEGGSSKTTAINGDNGEISITVTRSEGTSSYTDGCSTPTYTITIKNCYQNISIDTNFQDTTSKEIWLVGLDGVKPIYSVTTITGDGWPVSTDHTWTSNSTKFINDKNFKQNLIFYVCPQDGYEFTKNSDSSYSTLTVTAYSSLGNVKTADVKLTKLDESKTIDGVTYTHQFTIDTTNWHGITDKTSDKSKETYYRWTIALKATRKDTTYNVKYVTVSDDDKETVIATGTVDSANAAFNLTTVIPTAPEGKYFAGWQATLADGTDSDTLNPGAATTFDKYQAVETEDTSTGVTKYTKTVTFKAVWSDSPTDVSVPYTLKVIVHDRTGEYMKLVPGDDKVMAVVTLEEYGYVDKELYIPLSALNEKVIPELQKMGFTDVTTLLTGWYIEGLSNFTIKKAGDIQQIDFYQYATVNYEVVTEGGDEGEVGGTVSHATEKFPIKPDSISEATAEANANFEFVGWYSDAACENKVADDIDIKVSMLTDGWPTDALTFYAKFKKKVTDVVVTKVVDNETSKVTSDSTKEYSFTYTINNGDVKDFTITGNGTYTIAKVPVGSKLVITETNNELYDTTYSINGAAAISGSTATIGSVAKEDKVTFTNSRKMVPLQITKEMISSVSSDLTKRITFSRKVYDGETEIPDLTKTISMNLKEGEEQWQGNVPAGTKVVITEKLDDAEKDWYTVKVGDTVTNTYTIESMPVEGQTVRFTNTRNTTTVKLEKTMYSVLPSDKSKEVTFTYQIAGGDEEEKTITLSDGTGSVDIKDVPVGASFSVTEKLSDAGADLFEVTNKLDDSDEQSGTTRSIRNVSKAGNTVSFTNTRKTGTLKLTKTMESSVPADAGRTVNFKIDVYDGTDVAETHNESIILVDGKTVTAPEVTLPYGTGIVVSEVSVDDGSDINYYDTAYTINSGDTTKGTSVELSDGVLPGQTTEISFTNTRKVVDITVNKTVENAISADEKNYTFNYKVGDTGESKELEVTVTKGVDGNYTGTATITGVPVGEKLVVTETGYENIYDVSVDGVSTNVATIDTVTEAKTLNFINTRKNAKITIDKKMVSIVDADATKTIKFEVVVKDGETELTEYSKTGDDALQVTLNNSAGTAFFEAPLGTTYEINEVFPDNDGDLYTVTTEGVTSGEVKYDDTVKYTNTRKTAYIRIDKKATAGSLPESLVTSYDFDIVAYGSDGTTVLKTYDTQTLTIGDDGKGSSTVIEVPYKSKVVVTEDLGDNAAYFNTTNDNDNGGATATIVSAENTTATDPKVITFTNNRKMVTVTLNKEVVNAIAADKHTYSFNCTYYGSDSKVKDEQYRTFELDDEYKGVKTFEVPAGYTLVVRENPYDAVPLSNYSISWTAKNGTVDLDPAAGDTYKIDAVSLEGATLNCTNTRKITSFTVSKNVVTYKKYDYDTETYVDVTCGDDKNATFAWQYRIDGGDWITATTNLQHGNTVTIADVPIGSKVEIKELMTEDQKAMYTEANEGEATIKALAADPSGNSVTFTNTRKTGTVKVKKMVEGNYGDTTKKFTFVAYVTLPGSKGSNMKSTSLTSGAVFEPELLKNLPYGTRVTIQEYNYTAEGYEKPVISGEPALPDEYSTREDEKNGFFIDFTVGQSDTTIVFTNSRTIVPDTGVLLDSLPYVLILLLVAGIGTLVFIRRRRNSDD